MSRRNVRRLRPSEYEEQCAVVQWADLAVVEWSRDRFAPLGRFLYSVPNGEVLNSGNFDSKQRMARIGKLRRSGFRSGVLDLVVDLPRGEYHGARLEMKSEGNRPSTAQAEHMATLIDAGYHVGWADTAGDAIAWLQAYVALGLFSAAGKPNGAAPGMHRPEIAGSIPAPATLIQLPGGSHG